MKRPHTDPDAPFTEPWEAQAFAMTHELHSAGHFTWSEWTAALGRELAAAPNRAYYLSWLAALEKLAWQKGLTREEDINERVECWRKCDESSLRAVGERDPIAR